jgi:hypothetical protein
MTDIAIRVENLSKQYRIGARQAAYRTLGEALTDAVVAPFCRERNPNSEYIWALKDVSFEVQRGEVVGITLAATGRGRPRCSRSSPASPSRRRVRRGDGEPRSTGGWVPCWRRCPELAEGWAPAFTPN